MGKGQDLWKTAKTVIPGGNMLLSKRPEQFLPEQWPAYYSKAKGCRIWDLDGREYIDMSIMGIGCNTLGYGRPEVDDAVKRTVDLGNMATLNAPEEVELAQRLIALHPWADMARFAVSTGVRAGNLVRTQWDQVDLSRRVAWYLDTKNGEPLGVYLNDEAVAAVQRQQGTHPSWVFTYAGRPVTQPSTKAWYRALEKAGIKDFRWHDLRHT